MEKMISQLIAWSQGYIDIKKSKKYKKLNNNNKKKNPRADQHLSRIKIQLSPKY